MRVKPKSTEGRGRGSIPKASKGSTSAGRPSDIHRSRVGAQKPRVSQCGGSVPGVNRRTAWNLSLLVLIVRSVPSRPLYTRGAHRWQASGAVVRPLPRGPIFLVGTEVSDSQMVGRSIRRGLSQVVAGFPARTRNRNQHRPGHIREQTMTGRARALVTGTPINAGSTQSPA